MNNKGFAVSMILYSIMALLVFVMLLILGVNAANARNNNSIADSIKEDLSLVEDEEEEEEPEEEQPEEEEPEEVLCQYSVNDIIDTFEYTGTIESFFVPCSGTYKLEVYGAEGSGSSGYGGTGGGKGGYSYGNVTLTKNQYLYVGVGGKDGYNGGGEGKEKDGYGNHNGGGATHIAINSDRGLLVNYELYQSEILIVAGGGGGSGQYGSNTGNGGTGGGISGGNGVVGPDSDAETLEEPTGGTQTSGGRRGLTANTSKVYGKSGSFGQGGYGATNGGGGGGGWYGGGGAGSANGTCIGGAGGSGYIGGVFDGSMENGIREGNGYAQITLVSLE